MITRIKASLADRMDARKDNEAGFTLIELMVVILIIGILAAIAIPIYLNVQTNAKNSAAQADLSTARTAQASYFTTNNTYATTTAQLTANGFTAPATGSTFSLVAASATGYCMSDTYGGTTYYAISTGISTTACTAAA